MNQNRVSNFPCIYFVQKVNVITVMIPDIAHTFCASGDTRISLSVMLTHTGIFLSGLKLSGESTSW